MRIFILEDDYRRVAWFCEEFGEDVILHSSKVAKAAKTLREEKFDIIFLDHDLTRESQMVVDDEIESGRDLAKIMSEESLSTDATVVVHSLNEVGANLICDILDGTHSRVHRVDYFKLKFKVGRAGVMALVGDDNG